MSAQPQPRMTATEYLSLDRESFERSEFLDGEIIALSGASRRHNLIVTNLIGELRQALKGKPCEVYPSDMRVHVPSTGSYVYPDVSVVCGDPSFEDGRFDVLLNPIMVIEVLSPSTEIFDRGRKFAHYRTLPSLDTYLLVSQDEARLELFRRQQQGGDWLFHEAIGRDTELRLDTLGCRLALTEVYDKVQFPAVDPMPDPERRTS